MRPLIADAVNLIVSIVRMDRPPGRRIDETLAVTGFHDGEYLFSSQE
jgi:hypothetical protein